MLPNSATNMDDTQAFDSTPSVESKLDVFESSVEEYLLAHSNGQNVDRDKFAQRIPDPEGRRRFVQVVDAYLSRLRGGETVVLEEVLAEFGGTDRESALRTLGSVPIATDSSSQLFAPGALLADRFRVKQQVAKGGTAAVYLVRDEAFDVDRVLKSINHERATAQAGMDWEELALAEARALAKLDSRNIVTVHDIVRAGEDSYIVMDLLRGRDMFGVIRALTAKRESCASNNKGRIRVEWLEEAVGKEAHGEYLQILDTKDWYRSTARIARYLLQALELSHAEGICHRDIKPANIFLVGGGEPVLLDFGFGSCPGPSDSLKGSLVGTPPYMAPEQFRSGRSGEDPRTDLYQMGVALYEFVTLARPFDPRSKDFLKTKIEGLYVPLETVDPHMPPALAAILTKSLSPTPDGRYQSARDMRVDLERFEEGKPPLFAALDAATKARMWSLWAARKPACLVGLAGAALLVATWMLRTQDWVPPVLLSMYSIGEADPSGSANDQLLRWQGVPIDIGLVIDASSPSVLYAFELYGEEDASLYIRPLPFDTDRAYLRAQNRMSTPVLALDGSERWPIEEVYVLAAEGANSALDEFILNLSRDIADGIDVPFDEEQLAQSISGRTRGTARADLSSKRREALEQAFDHCLQPTEEMYSAAGVKPYRFGYHIQYEQESD